ncbi:MAG: polysulfide reductase NrfD [Deltaproteobacteria bacterium]|nr:polysulfide reductase NrfD [Deltaproteobacteria bacterium]
MANLPGGFGQSYRETFWVETGLILLIAWGLYTYSLQFFNGLGVTGLNKPVFWGLYIANFIFCVGLSAGGIAVSALVHILNKEEMKPIAIIAEILSISFLILAALFIILDMGQPTRLLYVIWNANFSSPLLWDVTVINSYLILCSALLFFSARAQVVKSALGHPGRLFIVRFLTLGYTDLSEASLKRDRRVLKTLAIVSVPAAVALHSVTAWILGLVKGQPGWNTPILAPLFISSALASGLAGVIVAVWAARKLFRIDIGDKIILQLGTFLFLSIPVLAYLLFTEFLTVGYSGSPTHIQVLDEILWGRFSRIFWFDTIVGILIPFVLLGLPWTRTPGWIVVASLLVIVGVFAERTYLLLPSLMRGGPFDVTTGYSPTTIEWTIMAAAYAFGLLLFLLVGKLIFPRKTEQEHAVPAPAREQTRWGFQRG